LDIFPLMCATKLRILKKYWINICIYV
jgi:hypothetical protein